MPLALFDFDGTITTHETMPEFLRRSVPRRRLLAGQLLFAPLVIGYKMGLVSGTFIRSLIVRFGYSGVPVSVVEARGLEFARSHLPGTLRPEALQRIAWHRSQGHAIVVVSGGLEAYLRPWCEAHGLELVCSVLEQRDGILTGRYEGPQCVLAEKARRVGERYDLKAYPAIYAYGDTAEDRHLLGLATERYYRWQKVEAAAGR
ncbi:MULTISPECIES: HAD family hydrolase [unclassified Luteimonas]|uniref:HAD family hydrolase n=2 Tax=Luteimonas TaxID=83614 RepID=UPI0018F0B839|nr:MULTISPECIES: HAD family hydrolase [unclassified Luteimonas]MBJ6982163.1 HAD family hydrolase [Luteimonas sp. MC1572]MBJ7575258.1 HAD family hydrolase [Luteimonas sp. MC1828]QQO03447.1 HAD family hydrolase [Luteimonas sp. MC1572]